METVIKNVWTKSKLMIKAFVVAILALMLMIPAMFIQDLVQEREQRQKEAITEVSSKWAGRQHIAGPVVVLPYWKTEGDTSKPVRTKHFAYFLPEDLNISSTIIPEEKHRGIYKVMLYSTNIRLSGTFNGVKPEKLRIAPESVLWNEAFVQLSIADVRGLNEELKILWNKNSLVLSPDDQVANGSMIAPIPVSSSDDLSHVEFSADVQLNGSEQLLFTPVGKSTTVQVTSDWPHPSFTGNTLPQTSQVKGNGFSATWKSVSHKQAFPRQWTDNPNMFLLTDLKNDFVRETQTDGHAFGVNLFVPVNSYQKTMRSVKYAALCILLTFAAFFLIETTNNKSVHPFQYGLIGLALILFYTLLLSFSEYTGFNIAYVIASACTIALIGWFVRGILGSSKLTGILSLVLVLIYTYVFTTFQLQDYSLILGSIGLFITLAVIMHFSKKIRW